MIHKSYLLSLLFTFVSFFAVAQNGPMSQHDIEIAIADSIHKAKNSDISSLELPPLELFFQNIYAHPSVGIYETYREEGRAELKANKLEWLNYVRMVANYQYGRNNALVTNLNGVESLIGFSNSAMNNYGVGVSVSIPLGGPFIHAQNIKAKKAAMKRIEYEYEMAIEERKLTILGAYNAVMKEMATLQAKSDAVVLYNAQMKIAEEQFVNGQMNVTSLSVERSRRAGALVNYEEGKVSLYEAISLLEMYSGVKVLQK